MKAVSVSVFEFLHAPIPVVEGQPIAMTVFDRGHW